MNYRIILIFSNLVPRYELFARADVATQVFENYKKNYQELPGMANLTSMTLEVSTWKVEDSWTKPEEVKK